VAAGRLLDDAPEEALAHALTARRLASRISAVREAVGLAAYRMGEWQTAITELRTYHRMSGRRTHLAVLADCERALGRPAKAIDIYRSVQPGELGPAETIELLIVAAGARSDLGQPDATVAMLEVSELTANQPWAARLRYAYADALLAAGRQQEAREWFARAADADEEGETDAAERLLEMDGVVLDLAEPDEDQPEAGDTTTDPDVEPSTSDDEDPLGVEELEAYDRELQDPAVEDQLTTDSPVTRVGEAGAYDRELPDPPVEDQPTIDSPATQVEDPAVDEGNRAEAAARVDGSVAPSTAEDRPTDPDLAPPEPAGPQLVDAYDLVILDLDGVVYVGEEPIPGAVKAIERLRREGPRVVFATNNASRSADQVAALLTRLGVEATATDVLTSAAVAADALAERLSAEAPVLVLGSDALANEVRRVGLTVVQDADALPAAVVQGYAPHVGWTHLAEACLAIQGGAQWIVTNTDTTLPTARGVVLGNGSLVAALRTALAREPDLVVGKPQPALFTAAAANAGAARPLVVGDRLDTDIDGAANAGMDSLLVLTGISTAEEARRAAPDRRPTFLAADLAALFEPPQPTT
jgi:glycerol 3-phosphatase-2